MLKNYFRVAIRTLLRQKGYASINVVGLAVGIACCVFLLLFVRDELSYDRFHEDADAIYRVNLSIDDRTIALTPTIVAPLMKREIPQVVATARVESSGGLMRVGDEVYDERDLFYADSTIFDVLTLPMVQGDASTALVRPNTVILTETTAEKYFGDGTAIGKTIIRNNDTEYEVTGVMADLPSNSHIQFDLLASFASRTHWAQTETWSSANFYTFVRLADPSQKSAVEARMAEIHARLEAAGDRPRAVTLQPITDIHLSRAIEYELDTSGDMAYVYGFSTLAVLILLMACANYMNLATARSAMRTREVGMRKSLGAFRSQLVRQFYGEAVLMTMTAAVLGCGLVVAGIPWFNDLSGKSLSAATLLTPEFIVVALAVFAVVSLVAGSYPALYMSGADPIRALRGASTGMGGATWLRKGLVVVQFGITAFLMVGSIAVVSQLRYMQNRHVGFDREHVVALPMNDPAMYRSYDAIRAAAEQSSAITNVSALNQIPGQLGWTSSMRRSGQTEEDNISVKGMPAEVGIGETLGLELVAGRLHPPSSAEPDSGNFVFVLNETAAAQLGWTPDEAIGQQMSVPPRDGEVVGVVRDFNFNSLHVAIEPLAIWIEPQHNQHIVARIAPGRTDAALADLRETLAQFVPDMPFTYRFLDDVYDRQYANERRTRNVVSVFAALAILVACLGLLGLASFTAEKRTREIGIRKVLGASVSGIVRLLSKDFVALVAVAFVLVVPLTTMALNGWLSQFAYHVTIGPGVYILSAAVILAIALLTVSTQALRAANADPVKSLRFE